MRLRLMDLEPPEVYAIARVLFRRLGDRTQIITIDDIEALMDQHSPRINIADETIEMCAGPKVQQHAT